MSGKGDIRELEELVAESHRLIDQLRQLGDWADGIAEARRELGLAHLEIQRAIDRKRAEGNH